MYDRNRCVRGNVDGIFIGLLSTGVIRARPRGRDVGGLEAVQILRVKTPEHEVLRYMLGS